MVISSSLGSNYLQQSDKTTLNIKIYIFLSQDAYQSSLDIKFSVISLCVTLIKDISIFNKKYEFHLLGVMYAQQPSQYMIDTETHVPSTKAHEWLLQKSLTGGSWKVVTCCASLKLASWRMEVSCRTERDQKRIP